MTNSIFLLSESPDVQTKTSVVTGEETTTVRQCINEHCIGWSKNLDIETCPFCKSKMEITERRLPIIRAVNSCRNCFFLIKSENLCMKKEKKLSYHASDYSENCDSFLMERKAKKEDRALKEKFLNSRINDNNKHHT